MKTRHCLIPALAAMFVLASCSPKTYSTKNLVAEEQPDGGAYTEKTVPVVTKVAPDGEVTLRFYDALPDVAYISAADFQSIVLPGSVMTVTHTGIGEYTLANGDAKAVVNVNNDVFVSDSFEAFTNQMGLLQPGMANVYYDGMPFVRFKDVTYTPAVATVTLDFAKYGIDIHADGRGTVYFPSPPLQTCTQTFSTIMPASTARRWSQTLPSTKSALRRSILTISSPCSGTGPVPHPFPSSTTRNSASPWTISTATLENPRDGGA